MADYKGRIRPPVYDGEGTATYPDVFYPETKSDLVKDPDTGETVKQQITALGAQVGRSISSVARTSGTGAPGTIDTYTITFNDGTAITFDIYNGANGLDGARGEKGDSPIKGVDYWTDTDKAEIIQSVVDVMGGALIGYVDENNVIVLVGGLEEETYTIKYEMEDESLIDIGELDLVVKHSVTNNLTNCTNSNASEEIVDGNSYSATISANDGYELSSIAVTMGGTDITSTAVSGGTISIAEVTGNVVITAVAEAMVEPTNFFVVGGDGYLNPGRASSAGEDRTDVTDCFLTNYIEVQNGDEIYAYNAHSSNGNVGLMGLYKTNKTGGVGFYVRSNPTQLSNISMSDELDIFTINYEGAAYMRVCCLIPSDLNTIKVNIKRNGEWL
jgi:hypothetical protein